MPTPAQRFADFADGAPAAVSDHSRGQRGVSLAIVFVDMLDDLFPALVLDWQRISDANGYQTWHARCLYFDGEPKIALVAAMRVRAAVLA